VRVRCAAAGGGSEGGSEGGSISADISNPQEVQVHELLRCNVGSRSSVHAQVQRAGNSQKLNAAQQAFIMCSDVKTDHNTISYHKR